MGVGFQNIDVGIVCTLFTQACQLRGPARMEAWEERLVGMARETAEEPASSVLIGFNELPLF